MMKRMLPVFIALLLAATAMGSSFFQKNVLVQQPTVTASAGGTTTLVATSNQVQVTTGATTQTYALPDATTMIVGSGYHFKNDSTGTVTVNDGSGGLVATIRGGQGARVWLTGNASTAGTWKAIVDMPESTVKVGNLQDLSTDFATQYLNTTRADDLYYRKNSFVQAYTGFVQNVRTRDDGFIDRTFIDPTVGLGNVGGPSSSTDNAVARFNGAGGVTIQNSGVIVDDSDNVTGVGALTASGNLTNDTSTLVTLATSNRVGIGTATPDDTLDVVGGEAYFPLPNATPTITKLANSQWTVSIDETLSSFELQGKTSAGATVRKSVGAALASDMLMSRIGASTYSTAQHLMNFSLSPGVLSGGAITNAGGANVNVAAGTGVVKATDSDVATLSFFDWAASAGNAIPSNTTRYVGVQHNSGSPNVVIKTTDTWNLDTEFPLGTVVNEAGTLHINNIPWVSGDNNANLIERFDGQFVRGRDERVGGLILANTGTRNVTVSAGTVMDRMNEFSVSAIDTSAAGTFDAYFRDGAGGWTKESAQTQWNNTQWDDGDGTRASLSLLAFTSRWFYLMTDGTLAMVYGQAEFSSLATLLGGDSPPTSVPPRIDEAGVLIGRIIAQQGTSTPARVETAFNTKFSAASVQSAADLSNGVTGSGAIVLATSPTLVTPTLGAAAATSLTLTSALTEANGGTGESTYTNGQLLIGNAASGLTKATLTAGANASVTNGDGSVTVAATPSGSTTQIQYNDAGAFGADADFVWLATSNRVGIATTPNTSVDINGTLAYRAVDVGLIGTINNLGTATASIVRLTGTAATTVNGLANGVNGKLVTLMNITGQALTVANESGSAAAADRIVTGTAANASISNGAVGLFQYDSGASRWRMVAAPSSTTTGGSVGSVTAYTPTFTGFGTVSVEDFDYQDVGDFLIITGRFTAGTATAVEARVSLPTGYTTITTDGIRNCGTWAQNTNLAGDTHTVLWESGATYLTFAYDASTEAGLDKQNANQFAGVGVIMSISCMLPATN